MILLEIKTKGSVGKSTISQQVLAPFFLMKDKPANLTGTKNCGFARI